MELVDITFESLREGELFLYNKNLCIKCVQITDAAISQNWIQLDPYIAPCARYLNLSGNTTVQIYPPNGRSQRTIIPMYGELGEGFING